MTVDELLRAGRSRLATAPFGPPPREALLLLARCLGVGEAQVLARSRAEVSPEQRECFEALVERRVQGEPVAYLFGEREFYGRTFRVDSRVLIPRPETEHLVEAALALELPRRPRILDIGTGSGCVAVTLALELPGARVVATDLSLAALALARRNARRLGASERVHGSCTDLAAGFELEAFDLVVSNPPYVDSADAGGLSTEVRDHEPALALFADQGGMAVITRLLKAGRRLRPGCPMILEIGAGQLAVVALAARAEGLEVLRVIEDYAGIPRTVVVARSAAMTKPAP